MCLCYYYKLLLASSNPKILTVSEVAKEIESIKISINALFERVFGQIDEMISEFQQLLLHDPIFNIEKEFTGRLRFWDNSKKLKKWFGSAIEFTMSDFNSVVSNTRDVIHEEINALYKLNKKSGAADDQEVELTDDERMKFGLVKKIYNVGWVERAYTLQTFEALRYYKPRRKRRREEGCGKR
ncbi:unnamed protein product [Ambrosiozyma monospora]|uniref:Unnamed protein product n=1 Tax=Ambrosiozyma monospora TaxID=43982 RepID=A0ACB5U7L0_AMBMO|nr:unnamed protein product [Ambrosiozyma monospora]